MRCLDVNRSPLRVRPIKVALGYHAEPLIAGPVPDRVTAGSPLGYPIYATVVGYRLSSNGLPGAAYCY